MALLCVATMLGACNKGYLDIVPDNIPTLDHVFATRLEAEKYLFTCYSFLPMEGHPDMNPAFSGGDEAWTYWPMQMDFFSLDPYNIARGNQNKAAPKMNYWDGYNGKSLWQGIRVCNIFLENIGRVTDISSFERGRWIAEAKFLKAYLHWYLFRMYGPIPVIDKNLGVDAPADDMKVYRQPADSVVNYIVKVLDEVAAEVAMPAKINNAIQELGRVTSVAALAVKARVLVTAASPLFNGNNDFTGMKNNNGQVLFNAQFDEKKWARAAEACKVAIDAAHAAGVKLYYFNPAVMEVDNFTKVEMNIRNAVGEKWNSELIWGNTAEGMPTYWLQTFACPQLNPDQFNITMKAKLAPPMKIAEMFYTKNGVPITEDNTWDYSARFQLRTATTLDSGIQEGYRTVGLHFEREPRFYADMAFDGSTWYMRNKTFNIKSKMEQHSGKKQSRIYSITGYYTKKLVNWNLVYDNANHMVESYPWPVIRLADLYLLYAEALNESGNRAEALRFLNLIRERAGLKTVENAWDNFSNNPTKYTTKNGLREIIQQERNIEMAFEGSRFWDLRRWKTAPQELSKAIYGWDILQSTYEDYNRRVLLYNPQFIAPRDYFWPIAENNLLINPNLVQNAGW